MECRLCPVAGSTLIPCGTLVPVVMRLVPTAVPSYCTSLCLSVVLLIAHINQTAPCFYKSDVVFIYLLNKKHLKNVGPIRHNEPPHASSPGLATVLSHAACASMSTTTTTTTTTTRDRGDRYGPMEMGPITRSKMSRF